MAPFLLGRIWRVVCASAGGFARHCLGRGARVLWLRRRRAHSTMTGDARDRHDAADSRAVPHPVLKKYYERESDRRPFVSALFDNAAEHYDFVCGLGSLGSGRYYRRWVLLQSGLRVGMKFLDVATGTGMIAQGATRILREPGSVVGLDPSGGMLQQAKRTLAKGNSSTVPCTRGTARSCPSRAAISTSSAWATRYATWPT